MFHINKSKIEFPHDTTIRNKIFPIEVIFSKKKTSSVSMKNNKLIFRLSSYLSRKQAQDHFDKLLLKISRKIPKEDAKSFKEIFERGGFMFSGEKYSFELTSKTREVKLKGNTFHIYTQSKLESVEKKVVKLLIDKYKQGLYEYVKAYNKSTFNYEINGFDLKLLKSKWGHCTPDNRIMLNLKLLNARSEMINYVICHELAHVKIKNHSQNFWDEVSKFCPNHKILRRELRIKPYEVFN